MKHRVAFFAVISLLLIGFAAFGQSSSGSGLEQDLNLSPTVQQAQQPGSGDGLDSQRVSLAIATQDYPVTPGDVYTLTYQRSVQPSVATIVIDSDYRADLGLFGVISTNDLTLPEFRDVVKGRVGDAYPGSYPRVQIQSVGVFEVYVTGEVARSRFVQGWGLTRLAELIRNHINANGSRRHVEVQHRDGSSATYDVFAAERFGRLDQNPRLRPGDTVRIRERGRRVTLSGEVRHGGEYELLEGDSLGDVLFRYGGGATSLGNLARVRIVRSVPESDDGRPQTLQVDATSDAGGRTELRDLDRIVVPSSLEFMPVVYLEGAFVPPLSDQAAVAALGGGGEAGEPQQRKTPVRRPLREGETLYQVLREYQSRLEESADLRNGFIRREGREAPIRVNMEALLFQKQLDLDVKLQPEDRIVVPFGTFEVYVSGEVSRTAYVQVQALTRLNSAISDVLTPYSSIRDVVVTGLDGTSQTFDLFRAQRYGERQQNPYLQPGDTVTVNRIDRKVTINGEVERPGTYQILPEDDLSDLVENYANGLTAFANPASVRITSVADPGVISSVRYVDYTQTSEASLFNQDTVTVERKTDLLPVVFFEGAVSRSGGSGDEVDLGGATTDQVRHQFTPGQTVTDAARALRNQFLSTADLSKAFLIREGSEERIPVNLAELLYSDEIERTVRLQRNDRIIVPFRQYFVNVSGAVANPGQYPYIPDRTYQYYLGLAGGVDPQRHIGENPRITSVEGERKRDWAIIDPEDEIMFPNTNPVYHLGPILSIATTILSTIALILSLGG